MLSILLLGAALISAPPAATSGTALHSTHTRSALLYQRTPQKKQPKKKSRQAPSSSRNNGSEIDGAETRGAGIIDFAPPPPTAVDIEQEGVLSDQSETPDVLALRQQAVDPNFIRAAWDSAELARQVQYPRPALRNGVTGTVVIHARVDAEGNVAEAVMSRSDAHRTLEEEALRAVQSYRFTAARWKGMPVESWVEIPLRFRLGE